MTDFEQDTTTPEPAGDPVEATPVDEPTTDTAPADDTTTATDDTAPTEPAPEPAPEPIGDHNPDPVSVRSDAIDPDDPGPHPDEQRDEAATAQDLEDSGIDILNPTEPASEATITITDHQVEVDFKGTSVADAITSVDTISEQDIDRLKTILMEESARRGLADDRPFRDVDTESLLILQNQIRGEMASR